MNTTNPKKLFKTNILEINFKNAQINVKNKNCTFEFVYDEYCS